MQTEQGFFGGKFKAQCEFVDVFLHEDQIAVINEYAYFSHLESAFFYLEKGLKACEKKFFPKNGDENEDTEEEDSNENSCESNNNEKYNANNNYNNFIYLLIKALR